MSELDEISLLGATEAENLPTPNTSEGSLSTKVEGLDDEALQTIASNIDIDDTLEIDEVDGKVEAVVKPTLMIEDFAPQQTVFLTDRPYETIEGQIDAEMALGSLNATVDQLNELLDHYGIDLADPNQVLSPKLQAVKLKILGFKGAHQINYFRDTLARPEAQWKQSVDHEGAQLRASKVKLRASDDPVLRIRNELGMGGLVQIPLWHSGIWLTLRTPSDKSLLELERRISADKIDFGRRSNGLVFSNTEVYATSHVVDFALEHMHTSTVDKASIDTLKELIRVTDVPQMAWGILLAVYPKGYPLSQPCVADPENCDHVVNQLINIGRISWTDTTKLTDRQKKHMANRVARYTPEKIKEYQDDFVFGTVSTVKLNENIHIKLGVPSLIKAQETGYAWVDGITTSTQQAFSLKLKENERIEYIREQALLTGLRQYSHWIESVVRGGDSVEEEPITDSEVLDEIIDVICANEELTKTVYKTIQSYIDGSTISLIALPRYKCPACQKEPDEQYLKHPHLIPLDVIYVFFILRVQKLARKMVAEQLRGI